jgi:hypothetical protein
MQFFNWAFRWQGGCCPLSYPSEFSAVERQDWASGSRYLLAVPLISCYFPRSLHLSDALSLPFPLPGSIRFLISISGGKFPCASLRQPFHDLHIPLTASLLFIHLTLLDGTDYIHSQGRPDPTRDPRRRQRFLPPPTLFPAGVILHHTPSRSQPLHPSSSLAWPFKVLIDN